MFHGLAVNSARRGAAGCSYAECVAGRLHEPGVQAGDDRNHWAPVHSAVPELLGNRLAITEVYKMNTFVVVTNTLKSDVNGIYLPNRFTV